MSRFTEAFADFARSHDFNMYRVAEIKDNYEADVYRFTEANPCQDSYSVAKAYTLTAVGLAYDRGLLKPEDNVYELLGKELPSNAHPGFNNLTVHMLLCHRAGFDNCHLDIDCRDSRSFGDDYLEYTFREAPVFEPDTEWRYSDAAFYVLGRIVEHVTGEPLQKLLWREVFYPLSFREVAWSFCPQGHVMGGTGLYTDTDDIVKLGVVYNKGGMYKGRRILSEEWVNLALERAYEIGPTGFGNLIGKGGMRGQYLVIDRDNDRVVAWHACDSKECDLLLDFIANYKD